MQTNSFFLMAVSANNLLHRGKEKFNHLSSDEKEFKRLYYWILSQLTYELEENNPIIPKSSFALEIREVGINSECVLLEVSTHKDVTFMTTYKKQDFYKIMQEVASFFEQLSGYHAVCYTPKSQCDLAKMEIFMNIA